MLRASGKRKVQLKDLLENKPGVFEIFPFGTRIQRH